MLYLFLLIMGIFRGVVLGKGKLSSPHLGGIRGRRTSPPPILSKTRKLREGGGGTIPPGGGHLFILLTLCVIFDLPWQISRYAPGSIG